MGSSLFYTWGNIAETAEMVNRVLQDTSLRMDLVEKGQKIAEKHFRSTGNAEEIISIYHNVFR